jgi:hypothetical protein
LLLESSFLPLRSAASARSNVIDLVAALQESLAQKKPRKRGALRLKFIPKFGMPSVLNIKQHEAAVEVPKCLVQRKQSES